MSVFAPVGSANVTTSADGATSPAIANIALTAATEASYALPANTRGFILKLRGYADLQLSFTNGTSGTTYVTVPRGTAFQQSELLVSGLTLFFQTPVSGQVLELLAWS